MKAGLIVAHQKSQPAHFRGNHRPAHGHRLQGHHAEALVMGGDHHHLGGGVKVGQRLLVFGSQEGDQVVNAQPGPQLLQADHFRFRIISPGIAANDGHADILNRLRGALLDHGDGYQQGINPLERLNSPSKENVLILNGDADPFFGFPPGDGPEALQIDARRDNDRLFGVGVVEPFELGLFGGGGYDNAVYGRQHLNLAVNALRRGHLFDGLSDPVFHVTEGMKHLDDGPAPAVGLEPFRLQPLGHQPRQPVMAVNQVVGYPLGLDKSLNAGHKLVQIMANLHHRDGQLRPGGHVDDPRPVAKIVLNARLAVILGAGENIHLEAQAAQLPAEITHVDIHAPRFLAAHHRQRAGVDAQHGNTLLTTLYRAIFHYMISCGAKARARARARVIHSSSSGSSSRSSPVLVRRQSAG